MKKIILILITIVVLFTSCSKSEDDNGEKDLVIKYENMRGKWFFKETIKADGSKIPYPHPCPNNRDYIDFLQGPNFKFYDHTYSCDNPNIEIGDYQYLVGNIVSFGSTASPMPSGSCNVIRITNLQINIEFSQFLNTGGDEKRIIVLTRD